MQWERFVTARRCCTGCTVRVRTQEYGNESGSTSIRGYTHISSVRRQTELENRQMMTAVELGKKLGWRGALESIFGPDEIAYISDANRCKFLDLLPLSKDNTIALEIGCGLGQHTAAIARRVKHLDVLEVRLLSALFTKNSLRTKFSRKRQFCLWRRRLPDTLSERYLRYRYP